MYGIFRACKLKLRAASSSSLLLYVPGSEMAYWGRARAASNSGE